jgi:hypothetical protein
MNSTGTSRSYSRIWAAFKHYDLQCGHPAPDLIQISYVVWRMRFLRDIDRKKREEKEHSLVTECAYQVPLSLPNTKDNRKGMTAKVNI